MNNSNYKKMPKADGWEYVMRKLEKTPNRGDIALSIKMRIFPQVLNIISEN